MTSKTAPDQVKCFSGDKTDVAGDYNEIADANNDGTENRLKTGLDENEANNSVAKCFEKCNKAQLKANHENHAVNTIKEQHGQKDADKNIEIQRDTVSALDGGWGWFIVAGAFINHIILGGFQRSSGVMYLQLRERYKMSATATSWVLALLSSVTLCMGPVVSALCNKFSIRFVVFLGSTVQLIGLLISGFSPNLWFLYFSYGIVVGFGRAMVYSPCLIIVGYYFNKRRGLAVGIATSGGGVGSFFPPMFEKLFDSYGFRGTFLIIAAVVCHSMISGSLFRPLELQQKLLKRQSNGKSEERRRQAGKVASAYTTDGTNAEEKQLLEVNTTARAVSSSENKAQEQSARRRPSLIKRKMSEVKRAIKGLEVKNTEKKPLLELSLLRNFAFTSMCIQLFMFNITHGMTFIFLPALTQTKGLTKLEGAYLLTILGISDAVSRLFVSALLDLKRVKKFRLIIYNVLMLMIGVLSNIMPVIHSFEQYAIVCVIYGIVAGTCVAQKTVVLVDILGVEKLSSAFGLLLLFQGIGSLIGPTIGGLLRDSVGSYEMSFFCGSAGNFIGASVFAAGGFERFYGVMYLQLRERYKMSATATSWALALLSSVTLCMGPVVSALCNKFSIRFVVFLGSTLQLIGLLISGFSPNLWFLYFSYGIIVGFGRAMVYSPCLIIVGYYFNKRRGLAVGIATSGGGVGSFFPPMFEKLFDSYGFRGTCLVLAAVVCHSMISGSLFRPLELQKKLLKRQSNGKSEERRRQSGKVASAYTTDGIKSEEQQLLEVNTTATSVSSSGNKAQEQSARRRPSLIKRKMSEVKQAIKGLEVKNTEKKPLLELSLLRNFAFTSMCIQMFMFNISYDMTLIFLPALTQTKGLTKLEGAYLLTILGISDAVSRLFVSALLDLKRVKKFRLIIYNVLMLIIGVLSNIIPVNNSFEQFAMVCVIYGIVAGTCVSQKTVVLVDILGVEKLSSAIGLLLLFQGIGSLIGPTIGGLLRDSVGSYEMSFFCGSAGNFIGALVFAAGNIWLYLQRRKSTMTNADGPV